MVHDTSARVAVVGGGLVGSLAACVLAKRGYKVDLYEYRQDIRLMEHVAGKSINLAMSVRGLTALEMLGLGDHIKHEYGIPMKARMIHKSDGSTYAVPYGKEGQCIFSVGRRYINEALLTAGERFPNLDIHFSHRLTQLDLDSGDMTFQTDSDVTRASADFVLGCDGAFSSVRKSLMRRPGFNFSQEYIEHLYIELCIPPNQQNEFAMPCNYLHIWPRGDFMLIALPNQDKSFTVTLFMPKEGFSQLQTESDLLSFFSKYFPDSVPLLGKESLVHTFFSTPPSPLVSVKCSPYNWDDKVLLLGDAAHAMVPFYGQGMNCGMEDVVILDEMLERFGSDRTAAFEEYTRFRRVDAHAICDLAMYNYIEMRYLVTTPSYLFRKKLDGLLQRLMPATWVPMYTSVTFTRMRYHQCVDNKKWQDKVLSRFLKALVTCAAGTGLWLGVRKAQRGELQLPALEDVLRPLQRLTRH